jgi:hypothetical protein
MAIDVASFRDVDLEILATLPPYPASVPVRDLAFEFFGTNRLMKVCNSLERLRCRGFDVITKNVRRPGDNAGRREACITRVGWERARSAAEAYLNGD